MFSTVGGNFRDDEVTWDNGNIFTVGIYLGINIECTHIPLVVKIYTDETRGAIFGFSTKVEYVAVNIRFTTVEYHAL